MTTLTDEPIRCGLSSLYGTPVLATPMVPGTRDAVDKRVLGSMFVPDHGVWLYPGFFPYIFDVVRDLELVFPNIQFAPEVEAQLDTCHQTEIALRTHPMPAQYAKNFEFYTEPMEHQEYALNYALLMQRCGVFFGCGLGKTKVMLDLLRHEKQPALVLAPLMALGVWQKENEIHAGGALKIMEMTGNSGRAKMKKLRQAAEEEADIFLVGFDTAKRYVKQIRSIFPYSTIIADESHYLRGGNSARTKGAVSLASKAARRYLLSGTPSLGNPLHMWGQLQFLGNFIPALNFWTFKKHYTISHRNNPRIVVGYKNLEMLNDKVTRISIKRTAEECLDLPERRIIDLEYELTTEQRAHYNNLVESTITEFEDGVIYEAPHAAASLTKMLQILSGFFLLPPPDICEGCALVRGCVDNNVKPYTKKCLVQQRPPPQTAVHMKTNPKLDALGELLEDIVIGSGEKVIVWGYFTEEIDLIEKMLKEKDIGYVRVRKGSQAQEFGDRFNETPGIDVYLANITTGVSVTLNSAAYMVYFGLTYKLDEYDQSIKRNHRKGQLRKTIVYRYTVADSALEYVAAALEQKKDIAASITDTINCVMCDRRLICLDANVIPFQDDCIYQDRVHRVITRPKTL